MWLKCCVVICFCGTVFQISLINATNADLESFPTESVNANKDEVIDLFANSSANTDHYNDDDGGGGSDNVQNEIDSTRDTIELDKFPIIESTNVSGTVLDNNNNTISESNLTLSSSLPTNQTELVDKQPSIRFNCTPVFRDETNLTSQIILLNQTTISDYLQLKTVSTFNIPVNSANSVSNDNTTNATVTANSNQSTKLLEPGQCTLLVFYLQSCPFSAAAASHFNALGRLFPQFSVFAIDAYHMYSLTMRFGVVGVPSMFLFHDGKLVSRYNRSVANIDNFSAYIKALTGLEPVGEEVNVTEADTQGPLVIELKSGPNYLYINACLLCLACFLYYFIYSDLYRRIKEHVCNMWNEAQFHHEHID